MKKYLPVAVTLGLLVILYSKVDIHALKTIYAQVNLGAILLAFVLSFAVLFLSAMSSQVFCRAMSMRIPVFSIYRINLQASYYALLFPGDVASAMSRIVKFSKQADHPNWTHREKLQAAAVLVFAERLANLAALLVILVVFSQLLVFAVSKTLLLFAVLVLLVLPIGIYLGLTYGLPRLARRSERLQGFLGAFHRAMTCVSPMTWVKALGVNLLLQVAMFVAVDLLFAKGLGLSIPWVQLAVSVGSVRVTRFIPLTVSGIGMREALYPVLLGPFGVPYELAVSFGGLGSLCVVIWAIAGALSELVGLRATRRGVHPVKPSA